MCKRRNKILSMLLVCCMMVSALMPLSTVIASAASDNNVAQVGSQKYENYQDAWEAVKNGGELTMLADWHIAEMLTVEKNAVVTVNMNGHMINRGLTEDKDSGEIFLVKENGKLTLNGNGVTSTEHWGIVNNGKWIYCANGIGNVKLNGSLLTGGYNDDGGGAIHIQENAEVRIDGVTVAGNATSDDNTGGAIRLQGKKSKLYLTNSAVSYNRSDDGGGAAIWVEGEDSFVEINNSKLRYNFVDVDYGDGGAIQINNGRVEIKNSDISYNEAGRNGGAVYVYNGDLVMDQDTYVSYNVANKEGGAIYVNSKADAVSISGCFIGNRAVEEGGVIYVNSSVNGDSGVRISNVKMVGNIASANGGGAVYVDSDNNVALTGKVVMHSNSPDSLHINAQKAIVEENLEQGSEIGIYTSWDTTESKPVKANNYQYFFSDKVGYEITKGADGEFYFIMSEEGAPTTYKVGNVDYELIKSEFNYTSAEYQEMSSYFYYSDGYFAQAPEYYNEHFASFAASMALASMPVSYEGEYSEEKSTKYIVDMFNAMGYTDIFVHYPEPEYFGEDAENLSTIGYAIAKKNIVVNGKETTVIAIGTRGLDYRAEWASNVTLGSGTGEAKGFGDAARQVKAGIDKYIADKGIDADSATFFITGYSRAGATSNLVAKKLTDEYGENKVYAYCFEAPKGGVVSEMKEGHTYTNIHNVINGVDIVPTVGPAQMGFIRYGVDHIVPTYKVGTDGYNEQKKLMLDQLAAINKNIAVDDTFKEATMEYIGSTIGYYNMISPEVFTDYDTAEDWIPVFIEKLQEYSMTDMRDKADPDNTSGIFDRNSDEWEGYRNFYSNYMWYIYFDETDGNKMKIKSYVDEPDDFADGKYTALTLEDAIANLMMFYFGMPSEKKDALTGVLGELDPDTIMGKLDKLHIYWSVMDDWRGYNIDTKNEEFNQIWAAVNHGYKPEEGQEVSTKTLEEELKKVLTEEEYKTLLTSLYVLIDFALDFVSEDYNITDANLLGTMLYNIGNIMQTHYQDVTYAWVRSYDSFYKVHSNDVIRVHGLKADGTTNLLGGYATFEAGWEAAVDYAEDHDYMDGNHYERIVVDLLADWNANEKGEFGDSGDDGFENSTIYVPKDVHMTINLNEHTINRGLGDNNELDGEVIFVGENADLIINNGTITGGNSDNGAGGIHVDDEATVTLNNVHVKGNTVDGDDGGGIALYDGATLIMNGGSISDNRNNSFNACYGAGVYVYESTAIFEGVTFRNNQNTYNPMLGTVLYADEDSVVTMNNCTIVDNGTFNEADGTVGSISLISIEGDSSVEIKNTEFIGNGYAESDHDSVNTLIYVTDTSHFLIDNCTFKNNSAEYILSALDENFDVVNTRFLDNSANVFYGYADDSITFTDCEFNNNSGNQWNGYYSFNFSSHNSKVKFVNCSFGNSTYNDRSRATFEDDSKFPASIFGEGSLAVIVASVALIASIASIIVNVTERKKKTAPVTATEQSENDE